MRSCIAVVFTTIALAYAFDERLSVSVVPNSAPRTVPFDPTLEIRSDDLPWGDSRIKKATPGCEAPEQVHLSLWSGTAVLVSWATCDAQLGHTQPVDTHGIRSVVFFGTKPDSLDTTASGAATSYAYDYSSLGYGTSYASPVLHHVLLQDLVPGQKYYYKVGSSDACVSCKELVKPAAAAKLYSFVLPKPHSFPLRVGVFGDPGQTYNTSTTIERLMAAHTQLLLMTGDMAYADNWLDFTTEVTGQQYGSVTYQPKWDTFGRLFEPLLSTVPMVYTIANHEIEQLPNGDRNTAYNHRFPTPYLTGFDISRGPTSFKPANAAGDPFSNHYYSVELPGVMKVIALTSYAPGQTFKHSEPQYQWLQRELQQVDRSHTPWLIVNMHAPWYSTYKGHFKQVECMRQAYEPLLMQHQVDIVFHGHIHAYERTKPVFNYKAGCGGPMHITIGDAGNTEGIYKEFMDQDPTNLPDYCYDPTSAAAKARLFPQKYQPQACYSWQDGGFCFDHQPEWSAYREPSFGFGVFEVLSPTRAKWTWHKNQAPSSEVADEVTILRGSESTCSTASSHTTAVE